MDDEQERWKTYDDRAKKYVLVPSTEVEKTIFHKNPRIWSALYRGIVVEPNQRHCLTGITVFDGEWGAQKFPRSRHQARIGSRLDSIFMPKYAADLLEELGSAQVISPEGPDLYWPPTERPGYLVHAHCWALLGHVIEGGIVRIELNLDTFVQAACHFWKKDSSRVSDYEDRIINEISPDSDELSFDSVESPESDGIPPVLDEIPPDSDEIPPDSDSPSTPYSDGISPDSYSTSPSSRKKEERFFRTMRARDLNPLFVPKLEEAMQRNRIRGKVHPHVGFGNFPLHLAILIIDAVIPAKYTAIDVQNARNLLEAFRWTLPDGYWQKRCDSSLLFELTNLKKTKSQMDWQALGLDVLSRLLIEDKSTNGLMNRERVLLVMNHIKKRFIKLL
ncbi:uncharacterized protein PGRI_094510 [Penicillium griseofulvum]|uniref:Uncharacterized protein n=1 Tax=Penicillium patulum TaxID=5078 RepID=A0A135LR99_PENPA|nr:uncharacterized protein PGRI_094510 [Penicillium griseofulvum]KXG51439.1 hypothetical protein PGRI_094510 [Penicillium griseofulvum]